MTQLFSFLTIFGLLLPGAGPALPRAAAVAEQIPEVQPAVSPILRQREAPNLPYRPGTGRTGPPTHVQFGPYVSVQVNVDAHGNNIFDDAANEPSLAVDPTNPNRMAIGFRQFDNVDSNFRQAGYAYSTDAGRHWTFPGVLEVGAFRSDPVLAPGPTGVFYYNSIDVYTFDCDVFRSLDGGRTWPFRSFAYGGDKAWMIVDGTNGIGRGNIYCTWSSAFTRSTDGGQTWMIPIGGTPPFGSLAVGPDGELYAAGGFGSPLDVMKSTNARDPGVTPTFALRHVNLGGPIIYGQGPNPDGLLGQTWIACDRSDGTRRGNVYIVSSVDQPTTDPLDVAFARSIDGGNTWSPPIRINDDLVSSNAWQWFGTMSVAPNGRIDVIWNDTRHSPQNYFISELYYSSSSDGGSIWTPNVQLSPAWDSSIGWPQQQKIGDYYHMVSDNVGANLAYAATYNGEQDVWFLRIGDYDCNGNGIPDSQDIANHTVTDLNRNGIPDTCADFKSAIGDE